MKKFIKLTSVALFFGIFVIVSTAGGWDCDVTVSGPSAIKKGETVTFSASGSPSGGSYSWSGIPNLKPKGSTAELTAFEPTFSDYIKVGVTYTTPKGKNCFDAKYVWYERCCAEISGPNTLSVGEKIILSGSGEPAGGSFSWENSNPQAVRIETAGNTASVTGLAAGNTIISLIYGLPNSASNCHATFEINVTEKCIINLSGTSVLSVGDNGYVSAETDPAGGTLIWSQHPNIESINNDIIYHSTSTPGIYTYEAEYTLMSGNSCSAAFDATFVKVNTFSGPHCVNSGETLAKSDFSITTLPEGFNFMVNINPLTYGTDQPYLEEIVTASIGSGSLDDASTTLKVINSTNKFSSDIHVTVPNYVSEPLKTLGLSEKLDLTLNSKFERFWECCSTFASASVDGATNITLDVSGGPFTVAGIPMPKHFKNYVTVDFLNIGLTGGGNVKIQGNYKGCLDAIDWSGNGTLSADINASAEAKARVPDIIILHGKLSGETGISQNIKVNDSNLIVSSGWGGLNMVGLIKLQVFRYTIGTDINHPIINKNEMPQFSVPLPSLK